MKKTNAIWQCERELEKFMAENDAWKEEFTEEDREKIRDKFPEDKFIIVQHETTGKWEEEFMNEGVDTTISPPETRYGRLITGKKGFPMGYQVPITEAGLYVSPPKGLDSGILIAVKPSELGLSVESEKSCNTPECGLFYLNDGLIKGVKIPPERVLGKNNYNWKEKKWEFIPNPKALENKEAKNIIDCIGRKGLGWFDWCECPNETPDGEIREDGNACTRKSILDNGAEPSYEQRYKECKEEETDIEKAKCLFPLLLDITKLQDNIQLAIPPINTSVRLSTNITNDANAILLDIAKKKGNMRQILEDYYLTEKVSYIIEHFNMFVHDYNRTKKEDFKEKITYNFIKEREQPMPELDRIKVKKLTFKDQDKIQ